MEEILLELKNGNIDILKKVKMTDSYDLFILFEHSPDKEEILSIIIPKLFLTNNWYGFSRVFFDLIYTNNKFINYTSHLLDTRMVKASDLYQEEIINIITKIDWGFNYIFENLEDILKSHKISSTNLLELLLECIGDNQKLFNVCLDRFLHSENSVLREQFIFYLAEHNLLRNKEIVVAALYQNPDDFLYNRNEAVNHPNLFMSKLPTLITKLYFDEDFRYLINKYYALFFNAESQSKIRFIDNLGYISSEIQEKYHPIFKMAEDPMVKKHLDFILTTIINANEAEFIIDYIQDEECKYENKGTTMKAFKVGSDKIIKFGRFKYDKDSISSHFLLAPTKRKVIPTSEKNDIYVEMQSFLSKTHNNQPMTKKDIENFLEEAKRQGLKIQDPHCLDKKDDNFGFLNSYKDATLVGVNSHEELPEWFKERPLVLYDIDLVSYSKDIPKVFIK